MALSEVALPVVFSGGVDTKTDSKSVAVAKLIALENGVFDKGTTIVKRTGYDGLAKTIDGGSSYATPRALAARGDELVLFADDRAYSYRDSSSTWSQIGRAQSIVHTERPIAATGTDQSMPDSATLLGVTVVAWEDSRGGVWWAVVELTSGRVLKPAAQLDANGQRPRVCVCKEQIHVYYAVPAASRIWCLVVNPASYLTTAAPVVLVGTLSPTNPTYDAMRHPLAGASVFIAWALDTGGLQVAYVASSGVLGSGATGLPGSIAFLDAITGPLAVACASATTNWVAVAYVSGTDVGARVLTAASLAVTLSSSGLIVGVCATDPIRISATGGLGGDSVTSPGLTDLWVWCEEAGATPRDNMVWSGRVVAENGTGQSQSTAPLRGHGLVSRGFRDASGVYVVVAHEVPFFPYAALLRTFVADATVSTVPEVIAVGRLLVGSSDGLPTRQHVTSVETYPDDDARIHYWFGCAREQIDADPTGQQFTETGIRVVELDFNSVDAFQSAEFGPDLVVAGALPLRYDGDSVAELGFHCAPDGTIGVARAGGGALTASASYLYAFAYEEVDAQGVIHPGPMSVGTLVTMAVGETRVTLTIPTYRLTSKRRVRIGVFRSESNDTEGGGQLPDLYRVTSLNPSATGSNGYLLSDTAVDTVTFVDDLSDLTLLTRERAYTNSGVLSNDPIGLGSVIAGGKDRLFWTDPTDPNVVRFTQARRDGYGPEVSADLSLRFDQAGGAIGALAVMDDALIAFKARVGIYFVVGPGPLPNPDAAPQIGFSPAQQLPSDVGCAAPRSVCVTADRVLFQASQDQGICHVDRGRSVGYIGAPVEAYNAQRVTSADLLPGKNAALFLTNAGATLLYDYQFGQWSTFTNHAGLDAVVVAGVYHYLRANAGDYRVFRASAGYLDASVPFLLYLETAWIKLAGYHQGFQKLWHALLLGKWISSHVLSVKTAIDYQPGWDEPHYVEVDASHTPAPYGDGAYGAGPYGGDSDAVYQQRIHVGLKCQAARFAIGETMGGEFSQTPPTGGSFELTELLLTGGALRPSAVFGSGRTQ